MQTLSKKGIAAIYFCDAMFGFGLALADGLGTGIAWASFIALAGTVILFAIHETLKYDEYIQVSQSLRRLSHDSHLSVCAFVLSAEPCDCPIPNAIKQAKAE